MIAIAHLLFALSAQRAHPDVSLSLEGAIRIAKARRAELTIAAIEVERSKLAQLFARLAWLDLHIVNRGVVGYGADNIATIPSLTARCSTTPLNCTSAIYETEVEGVLAVPVWSGWHNESKLSATYWHNQSAEAHAQATSAAIVVDVAHAYWSVRRAELVRAVLAKELDQYRELAELVGHQVSAGVAPPFEQSRVKAELIAMTAGLSAADREIERARAELGAALEIDDRILLVDDPREYKPTLLTRDEAEDSALKSHPELVAAEADTRAADYEETAARGGYWPQISLVAEAFAGVGSLPPGVPNDKLLWGAFFGGAQLTWPIIDAFQTWREVKEAELVHRRADAELVRLRHRVLAAVRARHAELTLSVKELAPLEEAVRLSRSTVDVVRRRYVAGTARLIEVLDVERERLRFEQDLIRHTVSIAEADVELRAAMGRL